MQRTDTLCKLVDGYDFCAAVFTADGEVIFNRAARGLLAAKSPGCAEHEDNVLAPLTDWLVGSVADTFAQVGDCCLEREFRAADGPMVLSARVHQALVPTSESPVAVVALEDITQAAIAQRGLPLALKFLNLLNRFRPGPDTYREILDELQAFTGFEAVGIRLVDGDDYPYFLTSGFGEEFVQAESSLCGRRFDGSVLRDEQGRGVLECMCGNIIRGCVDQNAHFFSKEGSFWSNNTTHLLATTTDDDRQARTRNRCNAEGYETVVLIPLKADDETVGLLQFNDRRIGQMSRPMLDFLQGLAASLGITLARNREQEALARQAEQLLRSNEDLKEFAAAASHDLREPLRTIRSFAQFLERRHSTSFEGQSLAALTHLGDAAKRLEHMIDALLSWARVDTTALPPAPVDCNEVLRHVRSHLAIRLSETGGTLRVADLPMVIGDSNQLLVLFQNLVSNGLKFHLPDVSPVVDISVRPADGQVVFKIADNGIGIAPEYAKRIFEMFQRLHCQSEYPGTGIGLALCRKIVQRHGGQIWVESTPGRGAAFFVSLPAA